MARLAIRMPKMSMTMTEGEVSQWSAKVGDTVTEGDVVCEVMTDKVDMEVESTVSGVLAEIVVESGTVDVGAVIGWVEGEDTGGGFGDLLSEPEKAPEPVPPAPAEDDLPQAGAALANEAPGDVLPTEAQPQQPQEPADLASAGEARATERQDASDVRPPASSIVAAVPRARGLATERGVDLALVTGTGPEGLVRVGDVEAYLAASARPATTEPVAGAASSPEPAPAAASTAPARTAERPAKAPTDRKAAVRAVVARTMTPSAAIPQFTVWREIELDAADTQRRGVSWTTVLLRAYAAALRDVPDLLCRWEDGRATDAGPPAVALAVATDRGLLVPIFREPDRTAAPELDQEIRAVVRSAHTGKLDKAYLGVANGSVSNLGGQGVDRFQALLTPPQASVLSLGSIRQRPVAVPGGVGLALTVQAGLTVDHRVADGAHAATLLARLAERLGAGG
ncbi:2-oxo acid dehydrogenase subunit E2 [Nocardioides sp. HDW12B]|uniref:dihydrolipoamide acetyltransferase family protein n=1 Tax=Nocardioides sp. HDW12B TaxID=2714939 RepID=UPI00140E3BB7|nr:dihydrolipoamide acetyltransferase family protein [Nocardioides sp. HDW12B]QIK65082.1 2-oxo acid dehydrogenase subunit E2 [Nocardioides sp. HDW12B]